jgi:hypothetical protein
MCQILPNGQLSRLKLNYCMPFFSSYNWSIKTIQALVVSLNPPLFIRSMRYLFFRFLHIHFLHEKYRKLSKPEKFIGRQLNSRFPSEHKEPTLNVALVSTVKLNGHLISLNQQLCLISKAKPAFYSFAIYRI